MNIGERTGIIVMNSISMTTIAMLIVISVILVSFGSYSILESYLSFPFLAFIIWLNYKGRHNTSRFIFTYVSQLIILALAISDRRTGTEYFLMAVACSSPIIYSRNLHILMTFLLSLLCYITYKYIDATFPFVVDESINYPIISTLFLFICGSIVAIEMFVYKLLLQQYSKSLDEANHQLTLSNDELFILNNSLDQKVQQRTDELESKNKKLGFGVIGINKYEVSNIAKCILKPNYFHRKQMNHISHLNVMGSNPGCTTSICYELQWY